MTTTPFHCLRTMICYFTAGGHAILRTVYCFTPSWYSRGRKLKWCFRSSAYTNKFELARHNTSLCECNSFIDYYVDRNTLNDMELIVMVYVYIVWASSLCLSNCSNLNWATPRQIISSEAFRSPKECRSGLFCQTPHMSRCWQTWDYFNTEKLMWVLHIRTHLYRLAGWKISPSDIFQ